MNQRKTEVASVAAFCADEYRSTTKTVVGCRLSVVGKKRKKKPWRLRWPDEFRARLLELNEQRHREELLVGSSQLSGKKNEPQQHKDTEKKKLGKRKSKKSDSSQGELGFEIEEEPRS